MINNDTERYHTTDATPNPLAHERNLISKPKNNNIQFMLYVATF